MARAKYQTIVKKARFANRGYSATTMIEFGKVLLTSIQQRMLRGQDAYDQTAPPLSARWAAFKERRYGSGIRDLHATGRTFRSMNVLEAGQNTATLGFTDPVAMQRVRLNNRIARQWAVSPVNSQAVINAVRQSSERAIVVVQEKVA